MTGLRTSAAMLAAAWLVAGCDSAPEPKQPATPADQTGAAPSRKASERAAPFVDNGDGTVTDTKTGLVWEKKCDCPQTLHDQDARYYWSADGVRETIWDWIAKLNAEGSGGFAGHDDWRVPNVKELLSLADYERVDPAVPDMLNPCDACPGPAGPGCGCTVSGSYWTGTTFADFPAHALVVEFTTGTVDDQLKTRRGHVRAVRGPISLPE